MLKKWEVCKKLECEYNITHIYKVHLNYFTKIYLILYITQFNLFNPIYLLALGTQNLLHVLNSSKCTILITTASVFVKNISGKVQHISQLMWNNIH